MPNITTEAIGVNRYAPVSNCVINLYNIDGTEGLTLGQLVMAVCIRRAASLEHSSVTKSNELVQTSGKLKVLADLTELLMKDSVTTLDQAIDLTNTGYTPKRVSMQTTIFNFLTLELGVSISSKDISKYAQKYAVYNTYKQQIEAAANLSQRQSIDLQSIVSRRDVTYNTSSSIVRAMQSSNGLVASNFKR